MNMWNVGFHISGVRIVLSISVQFVERYYPRGMQKEEGWEPLFHTLAEKLLPPPHFCKSYVLTFQAAFTAHDYVFLVISHSCHILYGVMQCLLLAFTAH